MLANLLPTPLHPAVVHLPIAFAVLAPLVATGALVAIHRGGRPWRAWGLSVALLALLAGSAWVATETGEEDEERVERAVPEAALETHEAAADRFLALAIGVLGMAGVGLFAGRIGTGARVVATVGTLGLLVAGYQVGHAGGELVYRYDAGRVHTGGMAVGDGAAPPMMSGGSQQELRLRRGDRDDDR